jgi:hypothetical protein
LRTAESLSPRAAAATNTTTTTMRWKKKCIGILLF